MTCVDTRDRTRTQNETHISLHSNMSFNIKSSFVSRAIVQANTEQALESDKKTSEGIIYRVLSLSLAREFI